MTGDIEWAVDDPDNGRIITVNSDGTMWALLGADVPMVDGARHAICPGPFCESRKVVVICRREGRISFHSALS